MTKRDPAFLDRLRSALGQSQKGPSQANQRHPARDSDEYRVLEQEAAAEIDALCERLEQDMRNGLADIEKVVGPIAEPMADQLAKGPESDVFAAAAEVLKGQIRGKPKSSS